MSKEIVRLPKVNDSDSRDGALVVPPHLTEETRDAFRRDALAHLERAVERGARDITLDCRATIVVDAFGLGVLVMLQKRAAERGLQVVLLHAREPVRRLLVNTQLDSWFRLAD
jgi:anti-anti-sigma factor